MTHAVAGCLALAGFVVICGAVGWAWRTARYRRSQTTALRSLDRPQRRALMRAIRAGRLVDPRHREVAVVTARAMIERRWTILPGVGVALTTVDVFVSPHVLLARLSVAVADVFLVAGAVQTLADDRRARRFLDRIGAAATASRTGGAA
ncbi:hypothetical protein ACXR2U_05365 [Jatrophihabitans sp. YIM 134969]